MKPPKRKRKGQGNGLSNTEEYLKFDISEDPCPSYLKVEDFGEKGRGVVASTNIREGSFVVIYAGKIVRTEPSGADTYVYEVRKGKQYWIDATADDGSFGRLINDDHLSPNLKARLIKIKNDYVPAFFALHDIPSGEEIAYDYGGVDYPWRRKPNNTPDGEISSTDPGKLAESNEITGATNDSLEAEAGVRGTTLQTEAIGTTPVHPDDHIEKFEVQEDHTEDPGKLAEWNEITGATNDSLEAEAQVGGTTLQMEAIGTTPVHPDDHIERLEMQEDHTEDPGELAESNEITGATNDSLEAEAGVRGSTLQMEAIGTTPVHPDDHIEKFEVQEDHTEDPGKLAEWNEITGATYDSLEAEAQVGGTTLQTEAIRTTPVHPDDHIERLEMQEDRTEDPGELAESNEITGATNDSLEAEAEVRGTTLQTEAIGTTPVHPDDHIKRFEVQEDHTEDPGKLAEWNEITGATNDSLEAEAQVGGTTLQTEAIRTTPVHPDDHIERLEMQEDHTEDPGELAESNEITGATNDSLEAEAEVRGTTLQTEAIGTTPVHPDDHIKRFEVQEDHTEDPGKLAEWNEITGATNDSLEAEAQVRGTTLQTEAIGTTPVHPDDHIERFEVQEDHTEGHCGKVFVCSGSNRLKRQLEQLVGKCGGRIVSNFEPNTTHVIMFAVEPRCCARSLKYFLGIAHHCWILDHRYVEMCLHAGYYLPEGEFEIFCDETHPEGNGASLSRQTKKKIFKGLKMRIVGNSDSFCKDYAEEILQSLGGEVDITSPCVISVDEGEPHTVSRDWIFDCLSFFTPLKMDLYYSGMSSCTDESVMKGTKEKEKESIYEYSEDDDHHFTESYISEYFDDDSDYVPETDESESSEDEVDYVPDRDASECSIVDDDHVSESDVEFKSDCDDDSCKGQLDMDSDTVPEILANTTLANTKPPDSKIQSKDVSSTSQPLPRITENNNHFLFVHKSSKKDNGDRIWDKRHQCVYCFKQYSKLARHLAQVHKDEIEVKRALAFDKKSKERKNAWKMITQKGDFAHNIHVMENGSGEIIPVKRPRHETEGTRYVQCIHCFGTYLSTDLWRHVKNAHPDARKNTAVKRSHQVDSASLMPVNPAVHQKFRETILNKMTNDDVSLIARTDSLITIFGQRKFTKMARNPHNFGHIRQKMRELARFVQMARKMDKTVISLKDCINPIKFSLCVSAVKALCGYNETSLLYEIPSLAKKLGHSFHKVAKKMRVDALASGNKEQVEMAEGFIEMYKEEWDVEVSHAALETLELLKYNKPSQIPLAEDLKNLSQYLKKEASAIVEKDEISQADWKALSELTLAQIALFNKRRAGETERLEVSQYMNGVKHGKTMHEEILESLSPLEKKLVEVINRVEIRGKRGRRVAILLPENLKKQLDLLLEHRCVGDIDNENKHMFARPGQSRTPLRATDVLRKFSELCGAKHPETLTTTGFRKHIATMSQMLNLKDNELDVLATFLGHDVRVHREFYRLPEDTIQVAKVSKLLLELEKGNIHQFKGKSLDEIQFDLEEPMEEDDLEGENGMINETPSTSNISRMCINHSAETDNQDKAPAVKPSKTSSVTAKKTPTCKKSAKRSWSENEKAGVNRQLKKYFYTEKLPGKFEIEEARRKEPVLLNRPWVQIKSYIKNVKTSQKRKYGKLL